METDDSFCVWQNDYNPKTKLCNFYITLFKETENGTYERYEEEQVEKSYRICDVKKALVDEGFEFLGAYSDFDFKEAYDSDERIYIVARCKKENLK